jgi:hypothetical protein
MKFEFKRMESNAGNKDGGNKVGNNVLKKVARRLKEEGKRKLRNWKFFGGTEVDEKACVQGEVETSEEEAESCAVPTVNGCCVSPENCSVNTELFAGSHAVFTRVCFCNIRKHQLSHKSPTNRLLRV